MPKMRLKWQIFLIIINLCLFDYFIRILLHLRLNIVLFIIFVIVIQCIIIDILFCNVHFIIKCDFLLFVALLFLYFHMLWILPVSSLMWIFKYVMSLLKHLVQILNC